MFYFVKIDPHKEPELAVAALAFSDGRPWWWRLFLGWRGTYVDDKVGFIFTVRQWKSLLDLQKYYKQIKEENNRQKNV